MNPGNVNPERLDNNPDAPDLSLDDLHRLYIDAYRDGWDDARAASTSGCTGYDEKSRGPEYRRGYADGRIAPSDAET